MPFNFTSRRAKETAAALSTTAPQLHPYDPSEYPHALQFALAHTSHPDAEPTFITTLTFLGGRAALLQREGTVDQHALIAAHKIFYPPHGLDEDEDRWEELGLAAAMEVYKQVAVQKVVSVEDRSEFVGRIMGECWGLGGEERAGEKGVQRAVDEAGRMAVMLFPSVREDSKNTRAPIAW